MASNSKDDVVIVKVENGRIVKRTNSTSDTDSQSQPRRKRKLIESLPSTDDVLLVESDTQQTSSSGSNNCHTRRGNNEAKNGNVRVEENDNRASTANDTETVRDSKESDRTLTEDVSVIEQQMLDHALALSLEHEELEKLSRNHISNVREYPITSLSSGVSPVYSNNLTASCSEPVSSHAETTTSLEVTTAQPIPDKEQLELPIFWQPMPENCPKNYELFMVLPGTEEFTMVTQQFLYQPLSVYSVKRIQNIEFLRRYTLEKKLMRSIRGNDFNFNEQRLFHTSAANPDDICEQGLDNRLSRFGGSFGAGIYFSDDVLKCHSYWKHTFQPALMFQCRVILGDIKEYPRGVRDTALRREPEKVGRNPGEQRTYDSVKGNITGRNEFVVYNAYRVMPEYMIEYTFTNTTRQTGNKQPTAPLYNSAYGSPMPPPPPPIPAAVPTDQNDPRYMNILSMMQKKGRGRGRGRK